MSINEAEIRKLFPALSQHIRNQELVYLDSAATALKPKEVVESLTHFYSFETANVHRGAHQLSDRATEKYEQSRETMRAFVNAKNVNEIVFTSGTTDGINLIAATFGAMTLDKGDEVLLTQMEHHSNIVPWQLLAKKNDCKVQFVKVTDDGEIDMQDFNKKLSSKTKIVSVTHCSNALGTVNDIKKICSLAHDVGAKVVVDAAQSASFEKIDVQSMGCDFLVFSMHKVYGPYGVGVLYGREELLNWMPPYRGGGSMIDRVKEEESTFLASPHKFEAGTPNISGVIASRIAIEFIQRLDLSEIKKHGQGLVRRLTHELQDVSGVQFIGKSDSRVNIVSFNIKNMQNLDVGQILDQQGVAVRTGHHCTQPLMERFGIKGTIRASFGVYNTPEDIARFIKALKKALEMLK